MRLRSSPPPLPRLLFPPRLLHPAHRLSPFILPPSLPPPRPPAVPPQRRHRLRRPPLNQVSDYLLEIDFTCSARFCICTSAPVRRTSAIVRATSWTSRPMGPVLILTLLLRLSLVFLVLVHGLIVAQLSVDSADLRRSLNSGGFLPVLPCTTIARDNETRDARLLRFPRLFDFYTL